MFKCLHSTRSSINPSPREECIHFLKKHYRWYQRQYLFLYYFWITLTVTTILCSAATSILLALHLDENRESIKGIVIVLPIISGILSSLLAQLKLRDTAQLRELGRIETSDLISKAFALPDEGEKAQSDALNLKLAAIQLERDQARRFFAKLKNKDDEIQSENSQSN